MVRYQRLRARIVVATIRFFSGISDSQSRSDLVFVPDFTIDTERYNTYFRIA